MTEQSTTLVAFLSLFANRETPDLLRGAMAQIEQLSAARNYVTEAIASFQSDPADSDFQRGYLAALEVVGKEALGMDIDLDPKDPEIEIRERRAAFRLVEKD